MSFLPKSITVAYLKMVLKNLLVPCHCFSLVTFIIMSNMLVVYEEAVRFGLFGSEKICGLV
jgi:metal-dependent hydrolase (beta-lactamase superfamily II)